MPVGRGKGKPFDSERASEVARKGWETRRAKAQEMRELSARLDAQNTPVDAPVPSEGVAPGSTVARATPSRSQADTKTDQAVIATLERKAQAGDIAAARELREWRRRDPTDDADADALRIATLVVSLPRHRRDALREWLLANHPASETPASNDIREGSIAVFDVAPSQAEATPADDGTPTAVPPRWPPSALEEASNEEAGK